MKVFLAFAFRPEDKALVGYVNQLFASHHVWAVTGEDLGGEQLTPAVQARIEKCDGLVALLTRRDAKQAGGFTTHQWVLDEMGHARAKGKRAIAVVENGVDVRGMYQPHEYIPFDPAQPLLAFLRLSETLGLWRYEKGRTLKVQILPNTLAAKVGAGGDSIQCSYRLWIQGQYGPWTEVTPVPEAGGTFVYVDGVQDDHLIQVRFKAKAKVWESLVTSQWMQVEVKGGK